MRNMKLQSAMEYLMTYGWAILIIAVVMVALFALGVFGGSTLPTSCVAASGFECTNLNLHSTTMTLTVGQVSSSTWSAANVFWVPTGVSVPTTAGGSWCPTGTNTLTGGVTCGSVVGGLSPSITSSVTLTTSAAVTVGTSQSGQFWAEYFTTSNTLGPYWVQLTTNANVKQG